LRSADSDGDDGRRPIDPFSCRAESAPGTRANEISLMIAKTITLPPVPDVPAVVEFYGTLAQAPPEHLELLRRRNAAIVFVDGFLKYATSDEANRRRRRPLDDEELADWESMDRRRTLGGYCSELDVLVFPTHVEQDEVERTVMHELGHALTMRLIHANGPRRRDLLRDLTPAMNAHVLRYEQGDHPEAIRTRLNEVFAEAYRLLVAERTDAIPSHISSELAIMLSGRELPPPHRIAA
jgi:hypothetical protein